MEQGEAVIKLLNIIYKEAYYAKSFRTSRYEHK